MSAPFIFRLSVCTEGGSDSYYNIRNKVDSDKTNCGPKQRPFRLADTLIIIGDDKFCTLYAGKDNSYPWSYFLYNGI